MTISSATNKKTRSNILKTAIIIFHSNNHHYHRNWFTIIILKEYIAFIEPSISAIQEQAAKMVKAPSSPEIWNWHCIHTKEVQKNYCFRCFACGDVFWCLFAPFLQMFAFFSLGRWRFIAAHHVELFTWVQLICIFHTELLGISRFMNH